MNISVHVGLTTGAAHLESGRECQDSVAYELRDGFLVFAIADGAGSASHSHIGSEVAVRAFCEAICNQSNPTLDDALLINAVEHVRAALERTALGGSLNLRDLHTTLLGGIVSPDCMMCIAIGDSMCFVINDTDNIIIPIQPTKGEAINETVFLTSEVWREFLSISDRIKDVKAVFACSDGLLNILYSTVMDGENWAIIPHDDVLFGMVQYLQKANDVENDQELCRALACDRANNLNDDDKVLLLALCRHRSQY